MKRSPAEVAARLLPVLLLILSIQTSQAGSATWKTSPPSNVWNDSGNWTPATIPGSDFYNQSDIATFGTSNTTSINVGCNCGAGLNVQSIVFKPGASAYIFTIDQSETASMWIGQIVNNSGVLQKFVVFGGVDYYGGNARGFGIQSSAGTNVEFTLQGTDAQAFGGALRIGVGSSATADQATIITMPGSYNAGFAAFTEDATAGTATIINNGGAGAYGGLVLFYNQSTAGSAKINNNGADGPAPDHGGAVYFLDQSDAGSATLIADAGTNGGPGGYIEFANDSTGGNSVVYLNGYGGGKLDLSYHNTPGVTIGSLQGAGDVFLGSNNLTILADETDSDFSGSIHDGGGNGGTGGSVTIGGKRTVKLSGVSSFTGEMTIDGRSKDLEVVGGLAGALAFGCGLVILEGELAVINVFTPQDVDNQSEIRTYDSLGIRGSPQKSPSNPYLITRQQSASDAPLTIGGNYNQGSGATLRVQISGTDPALIGRIAVGGAVTLQSGAKVTLAFANNFAPKTGDSFNFLSGGSVSGNFSQVSIAGLLPGFQYNVAPDANGNFNLVALNDGVAAPPLTLTSAVSRKTHGSAGTFDVNLPLTGTPGVECRSSGGNYTLVFTFNNNVTSGSALVSGNGSLLGTPVFSGHTMTVNLTGVANAKTANVSLRNVTDQFNQLFPSTIVSVSVLIGDTTGNGIVNSSDIAQTQSQSGKPVTSNNFREDVTGNGAINSSDIALVQSKSGTGIGTIQQSSSSSASSPASQSTNRSRAPRRPQEADKQALVIRR